MSDYQYPFSTERSSLLNTETFRNLLGSALENSSKSVIILSAYVKKIGVNWLKEKIGNKNIKCLSFIFCKQRNVLYELIKNSKKSHNVNYRIKIEFN